METEQKINQLTEASKPLIKHLAENFHPHVKAIVTNTGVEVLEGCLSNQNVTEFLRD